MIHESRDRLSVDNEIISEAKHRFLEVSRCSKRRLLIGFDTIYALLKEGYSFSYISEAGGVSRERMRQLYGSYFSHLFTEYSSGRDRQKKLEMKRAVSEQLIRPEYRVLAKVAARAQKFKRQVTFHMYHRYSL